MALKVRISAILLDLIFVTLLVFSGLAGSGSAPFCNTIGDTSDMTRIMATPAAYTFSVWGVIYGLLTLSLLFATVFAFAEPDFEETFLGLRFLLLTGGGWAAATIWLFLWDREYIWWSAGVLLAAFLATAAATTLQAVQLRRAEFPATMYRVGNVIFLNALGTLAAWLLVASLLNLGQACVKNTRATDPATSELLLSILMAVSVAVFALEVRFKDTFVWLVLPHLIPVWASIGILTNGVSRSVALDVIAILVIIADSLMFVTKALLRWQVSMFAKNAAIWKNLLGLLLLLFVFTPAQHLLPERVLTPPKTTFFLERRPQMCVTGPLAALVGPPPKTVALRCICTALTSLTASRKLLQKVVSAALNVCPPAAAFATAMAERTRDAIAARDLLSGKILWPARFVANNYNPESQADVEVLLAAMHVVAFSIGAYTACRLASQFSALLCKTLIKVLDAQEETSSEPLTPRRRRQFDLIREPDTGFTLVDDTTAARSNRYSRFIGVLSDRLRLVNQ